MKKLLIFDMDGTIYLGNKLIEGALETFEYLCKNEIRYVFFTNNSSHSLESYYEKITSFGIKSDLKENYCSSTEITISYLIENGYKDIYVVGNKFFLDKLKPTFNVVTKYDANQHLDAVIIAFSTELNYQELRDCCLYLETKNIVYIATNGDYRCPIEDGLYIPDCGGMAEWIRLTTNKSPMVLGKPSPEIIYYLADKFNVELSDILVIGDRIYTDILCGVNAKADTLLVLSGETTLQDLKNYDYSPTYILKSIKELPDLLEKI